MKKVVSLKKTLNLILILFTVLVLAGCGGNSPGAEPSGQVTEALGENMAFVYYIKSGFLVPVSYNIDVNSDNYIEKVSTAINLLFSKDVPKGFESGLAEAKINSLDVNQDTVSVDVSGQFLSNGKTQFAVGQIVYTLTECDNILHVNISVDGKAYANMLERPKFINPVNPEQYAQDKDNPAELSKYVTVYYTDSDKKYLIPLTIKTDKTSAEDKAKEALRYLSEGIEGIDGISVFPNKMKIREFHIKDGTAEIDLDLDALFAFNDEVQYAEIAIDSAVRTLTSIDGINQVQLLVNGKKLDYVTSNMSIKDPIKPEKWYNKAK